MARLFLQVLKIESCGKHARDLVNFEMQHWCHMIHMFNEHLKKDHEENGSTFKKKDT